MASLGEGGGVYARGDFRPNRQLGVPDPLRARGGVDGGAAGAVLRGVPPGGRPASRTVFLFGGQHAARAVVGALAPRGDADRAALGPAGGGAFPAEHYLFGGLCQPAPAAGRLGGARFEGDDAPPQDRLRPDRKSTRLNSSHSQISYAVFCLKKKK